MLKRIDSFHGNTSTTVWDAENKCFASKHYSLSLNPSKGEVVTATAPSATTQQQPNKPPKNLATQQSVIKPSRKGQSPVVQQPDIWTLTV